MSMKPLPSTSARWQAVRVGGGGGVIVGFGGGVSIAVGFGIATGINAGHERAGSSTRYSDVRVWR